MSRSILVQLDLPADLEKFRLPEALHARLQTLLDRQDSGEDLSPAERHEAEGLVELADLLTLLRLRARRAADEDPIET